MDSAEADMAAVTSDAGRGARQSRWGRRIATGLLLVVALMAITSLAVGPARLPLGDVLAVLAGRGDPTATDIVLEIRMPRAILAAAIGAMLGLAGAALQGLLRNPLADPAVIGTSNTAALGAVIALYFGLAKTHAWALPVLAIVGALVGLAMLFPLVRRNEGPITLILSGVAVSAIAGAGVSLALNLSPNPYALSEITFWLMGSLSDRSTLHLWLALPPMAAAAAILLLQSRSLDALALGEDAARSMGFDLNRTTLLTALAVALGVGAAVAVSGAIGFIGLIAPHLVRRFTDGRPSRALLPSALAGAALLTAADLLVRLIPTATELRLGVLTAMLGAPVFVVVLLRARRLG